MMKVFDRWPADTRLSQSLKQLEFVMILVREVIQLKAGKAKEAKALWKEAVELQKKYDAPVARALTDVTGSYYNFVLETTFENVADWEQNGKMDPRGAEEWGAWYARFSPLIDSGRREIFTVVE